MRYHLSAFFFCDFVDRTEEKHQRLEIEQLKDALTVLANTSQQDVVHFSKVLAKIYQLVAVLRQIHRFDYSIEVFQGFVLHDVVGVMLHAFVLLVHRFKQARDFAHHLNLVLAHCV